MGRNERGAVSTLSRNFSADYEFQAVEYNWLNPGLNREYEIHSNLVVANYSTIKDDIRVFNDLKGYKDLGFELIIQRQYDEVRIEADIVKNYLNVSSKLHFFPPLTIALIPKEYSSGAPLKSKYVPLQPTPNDFGKISRVVGEDYITETHFWQDDKDDTIFKELESRIANEENINDWPSRNGTLRWDKNYYNAVIIDGQHRYIALKKWIETQYGENTNNCYIPLNFILLFPKIGCSITNSDLVQAAREVFIDINKNAQEVSLTRQILLDDRDLKMCMARESIRQYNKLLSAPLYDWQEFDYINRKFKFLKRIPQECISWNLDLSFSNKENGLKLKSNQITSTTIIYSIIRDFIMSPGKNEDIFTRFESVLEIQSYDSTDPEENNILQKIHKKKKAYTEQREEIIKELNEKRKEHIDVYGDDEDFKFNDTPYERKLNSLDSKALDFDKQVNDYLISIFFNSSGHGKFLTRFYTMFTPYQKIIETIEPFTKAGKDDYKQVIETLIDPPKERDIIIPESTSDEVRDEFKSLLENLGQIRAENEDVIKNIVFQKAVLSNIPHYINTIKHLDGISTNDERISKFLIHLNELLELGVLNRKAFIVTFNESEINKDNFLHHCTQVSFSGYSSMKPWDGIWNNVMGEILYRDSDALKIGHLLNILICALYQPDMSISDLKNNTFFLESMKKVTDSYFSFYLNKIKNHYDYSTQTEVFDKIFIETSGITKRESLRNECSRLIESTIEIIRISRNKKRLSENHT